MARLPAITKVAIYNVELALLSAARERYLHAVADGELTLDEILTPGFLRQLHSDLFAGIWTWAGRYRRTELNLGVEPHLIQLEVANTFGNLHYQWYETDRLSAHQLGIATHAELVRIHPFADGNGRTTRLLADLTYAAAQDTPAREYDWDVDKRRYVELLRLYDANRDPSDLAEFIGTVACRGGR